MLGFSRPISFGLASLAYILTSCPAAHAQTAADLAAKFPGACFDVDSDGQCSPKEEELFRSSAFLYGDCLAFDSANIPGGVAYDVIFTRSIINNTVACLNVSTTGNIRIKTRVYLRFIASDAYAPDRLLRLRSVSGDIILEPRARILNVGETDLFSDAGKVDIGSRSQITLKQGNLYLQGSIGTKIGELASLRASSIDVHGYGDLPSEITIAKWARLYAAPSADQPGSIVALSADHTIVNSAAIMAQGVYITDTYRNTRDTASTITFLGRSRTIGLGGGYLYITSDQTDTTGLYYTPTSWVSVNIQ